MFELQQAGIPPELTQVPVVRAEQPELAEIGNELGEERLLEACRRIDSDRFVALLFIASLATGVAVLAKTLL